MSQGMIVIAMTSVVALAAALLAWALIDIAARGLARYRQLFTERANVSLRELFLFIEPERLFAMNLALLVLAAALTWIVSGSAIAAAIVAALTAVLPRAVLKLLRQRRMDAIEQQLPDALLMLAGALRAGVSLMQGVQQLVLESRPPISQEFDVMLREQRLGVSLDEALQHLNERVPLQSLTLAVAAMRIAHDTGGQLAEALERASQTLRNKLAMEGKIRALTAQGKLQAVVVGLLPVVLIAVLNKMEPQAMGLMFTTRIGWATLAVIALLEFFGVLIIRKIVSVDV
ncbi:MAG TPA: type II secretion system F family protein [Burkholderiaceae bacterium]|nr:type II secretion system F family protein [Burkholderiaceae bacterium]